MESTIKVEVITTAVYEIKNFKDTSQKSERAVRKALRGDGIKKVHSGEPIHGTTIIKVNDIILTGR